MFGVGFVLFSIYLVFLIWNIKYNGEKQKEENYPNLDLNTEQIGKSIPGELYCLSSDPLSRKENSLNLIFSFLYA